MTPVEKARDFAALHKAGNPLVLYNVWDAGSAKTLEDAGAKAVATGSWPVAAAQGYADGQNLPLEFLAQIVERIAATIDVPLSVDFEGGYDVEPVALVRNVARIIQAGAVGINFEDQIVGGSGLHEPQLQAKRIMAVSLASEHAEIPLFINARTDMFLKEKDLTKHAQLVPSAIERAKVYRHAGARGFFVPGLIDYNLIAQICSAVDMPVNVLKKDISPSLDQLAEAGVARISYGPGAYLSAMADFKDRYMNLS